MEKSVQKKYLTEDRKHSIDVPLCSELMHILMQKAKGRKLAYIGTELFAIWAQRRDLAQNFRKNSTRRAAIRRAETAVELIRQRQLVGWDTLFSAILNLINNRDFINAKTFIGQAQRAIALGMPIRGTTTTELSNLIRNMEAAEIDVRLETACMYQAGPPTRPGMYVIIRDEEQHSIVVVEDVDDKITRDESIEFHYLLPASPITYEKSLAIRQVRVAQCCHSVESPKPLDQPPSCQDSRQDHPLAGSPTP